MHRLCTHACFYFCEGAQVKCFCFSSGGEWQRTGVIGSSLSPQTSETLYHRRISFQFSKSCHTSGTIKKVFFPPNTRRKNASQQLFNHPFDCLAVREQAPLCSQGEKTRLECMRRGKQAQLSNATLTLCGQCRKPSNSTGLLKD